MGALTVLQERFPSVRVRLQRKAFREDIETVRRGETMLGIVSGVVQLGHEFESRQLSNISLVAVAAPTHPLSEIDGEVDLLQARGHHQLVWNSESSEVAAQDFGVHALDTWSVTDLETKLRLLRAGLGWGSMPSHMVRGDLRSGTLKELKMQSWEGLDRMPEFPSFVIRLRKTPSGPAARLFMQELVARQLDSDDGR
jgi:DNA-binding transcriptional LysR family regulator